jgi:hypothetical protein
MEQGDVLTCALEYENLGYSIIPVGKDKKPLIKWEEFQKRKASRKEIIQWFMDFKEVNIGIVTGEISNLVVVDLDDIQYQKALEHYLPPLLEMPISSTPRGGRHFYFNYPSYEVRNATNILNKVDIRGEGGYVVAPPSSNGNGKNYEWLPELSVKETHPVNITEDLKALLSSYSSLSFSSLKGVTPETVTVVGPVLEEGKRNDQLFHAGLTVAKGGESQEYVFNLLKMLALQCVPPYPEKELPAMVASIFARVKRKEVNLSAEVERILTVTDGDISVTELVNSLQPVTGVTSVTVRDNVRQILHRLKAKGIIKKSGRKDGVYRYVDKTIEVIDFSAAPTDEYNIKLPLDLNHHCCIYPGNVIVIAGSKSAGKTAMCLNIAKDNMDTKKVVYLTSEMGDTEMRSRLEAFDWIPFENWKKMTAIRRVSDWADLIDGEDKIFIIDYLEINQDRPWMVGDEIKAVFEKLKDGVCIIALQKNPNSELARGGASSLDKSRLYLSLDFISEGSHSRMKIIDCKTPRGKYNPRGMIKDYKLIGGSKYEEMIEY